MNPRPTPPGAPPHGTLRPTDRPTALCMLHSAVALFGLAGLFGKWIAAPALLIVFGRVLVASLGFVALLRVLPLGSAPTRWRQRFALWACGALLALHWASFFQAIQVSTVAIGLLAYSCAPVAVVLLEPLWFREPISRRALACALLAVAGVVLIVPHWALGDAMTQGVAWGVLAGLSFALLSLANRALVRAHGAVRVALHQDAAAMVLLAPLLPWVWQAPSLADLALLAVLGLLCTALAHGLFIQALSVLPARTAALAGTLEPVYGIALAALLLGERPGARTLAGGAVILAAVWWSTERPDPNP